MIAKSEYMPIPTSNKADGFTFVDLLVLMVSIAIQAARLLPALAKANEKARGINYIEGDPNALWDLKSAAIKLFGSWLTRKWDSRLSNLK